MRARFARICGATMGRFTCKLRPGHSGQHQDGVVLWGADVSGWGGRRNPNGGCVTVPALGAFLALLAAGWWLL